MTSQIAQIAQTYDETPYLSAAYPLSTPEHMRAVAHLAGLRSTPPEYARVLEIGCASGGNLIPFASRHPGATVVGIDLSAVQIRIGQEAVVALGLRNLTLQQGNLAEVDPASLGTFDYILCHGVYSWVPDDVRDALLHLIDACLATDGIAYVSYNTYPGWKTREIVRDAMRFRASGVPAADQLPYARGIVEFLQQMTPADSLMRRVIDQSADTVHNGDVNYVMHEYLETCNQPCYFRDFVAEAERHGLGYLGDSEIGSTLPSLLAPNAADPLQREYGQDRIGKEQMLDFINDRTFRQSLLVKRERAANVSFDAMAQRLRTMHVGGLFDPVADDPDRWSARTNGVKVTAKNTVAARLVAAINAAWPDSVSVETLIREVSSHHRDESDGPDAPSLALALLRDFVASGALRCRVEAVQGTRGDLPAADPTLRGLVVLRAKRNTPILPFNVWHEPVNDAGPVVPLLLPLIDGEHDARALRNVLASAVAKGDIRYQKQGITLIEQDAIERAIDEDIERTLRWMSNQAITARWSDARETASRPAIKKVTKKR